MDPYNKKKHVQERPHRRRSGGQRIVGGINFLLEEEYILYCREILSKNDLFIYLFILIFLFIYFYLFIYLFIFLPQPMSPWRTGYLRIYKHDRKLNDLKLVILFS